MSDTPDTSELYKLSEPPDPTLQEAVPLLARLTREPAFLDSYVRLLVEQAERAEGWHLEEALDGVTTYRLFERWRAK